MGKLWNTVWALLRKYRRFIVYAFYGTLAALLNIVCYWLLYEKAGLGNTPSTVLAFLAAMFFAFVANKFLVFESRDAHGAAFWREAASFFACRLLTGALDVLIMYLAVDRMGWNGVLWKLVSNVAVTVLNYVASRFFIFKKKL